MSKANVQFEIVISVNGNILAQAFFIHIQLYIVNLENPYFYLKIIFLNII